MINEDYTYVLEKEKYVELELIKILWQLMDEYNYPSGKIEQRYFITPNAHTLDRYIESTYLDNIEILTLEISGREVSKKSIGYREDGWREI